MLSRTWRMEFNFEVRNSNLLVGVFGVDLELLFAGFANPVVFAFDESVVVNSFAVVFSAEITLHGNRFYRTS